MPSAFALPQRARKPRRRGLTSMIDFGPDTFGWTEVNLANVTPGQILRVEGFRCGIGRAVDHSIIAR